MFILTNFIETLEKYLDFRQKDYTYRYILFMGFTVASPFFLYATSGAFDFINFYAIGEMELARGKTVLSFFLTRIQASPMLFSYSYRGTLFSKPVEEWTDFELYSMILLPIPGLEFITLFRDYRDLHDLDNLERNNWFFRPIDPVVVSFVGGFFFFGCLINSFFFFSSFAFSLTIVIFIINEFAYELGDSFRYLSSLSQYQKLFYKQIVFLPKVVEDWAGHSFFTKKLEREVQHFRAFYEEQVVKGFSHSHRVAELDKDPLVALYKMKPEERGNPEGFSLMPEVVKYDRWLLSPEFAFFKKVSQKFNQFQFSEAKLQRFLNNMLPDIPNWETKAIRSHILFFAYNFRYASTNDPAVIQREFMSLDFRNSFMKEMVIPAITQDQHDVIKKIFTPEGFMRYTEISEFEKFFGKEFMDDYIESHLDFAQREYRELKRQEQAEKLKKKQEKQEKILQILQIKFDIEQQQFFSDFLISLIPIILEFLHAVYLFLWKVSFNFLNRVFLFFIHIGRSFWQVVKQTCLYCYKLFFIILQNALNYPLMFFFFFFENRLTLEDRLFLKKEIIRYNQILQQVCFYYLIKLRKNFSYRQLFKFDNISQFWSFLKHYYYTVLLEVTTFGRVERYTSIFQWMENDDIRTEVIAEVLMHRKDMGHQVLDSDYRFYDDPRIVSLKAYLRVFVYHFGLFFGIIIASFFGALPQVVFWGFHASTYQYHSYIDLEWQLHEYNSNSWYDALGAWCALNSDWFLFETWFDSVPYTLGHNFRHYADVVMERFVIEDYETQGHPSFYADDTIYEDPEQTTVFPYDLGILAITTTDLLIEEEKEYLANRKNYFGEPLQFYEIPYSPFLTFMQKHQATNTDFCCLLSDAQIFEERRERFSSYAVYKYLDKIYADQPDNDAAGLFIGGNGDGFFARLKRAWKFSDLLPFTTVLSGKEYITYTLQLRFPELAKMTTTMLEKKKPYQSLAFEMMPAYADYQFQNYPVYRLWEIWEIEHHESYDEDVDDLDYLDNSNVFISTNELVFLETRLTLKLLDLDFFFFRLFCKYQMEIEAAKFFFFHWLDLFCDWFDNIDFKRYNQAFFSDQL
jgi:hypothetical protein